MGITPISDRSITQQVISCLASRGLSSSCRLSVEARNGEITLSGTVQHAHQKSTAVQATRSISGVRRVIDRLIVKAAVRY
jgi:osmotically-inducible protein OsmY